MKVLKVVLNVTILTVLVLTMVGCAAAAPAAPAAEKKEFTYNTMTMCYPQLGAESDWRTANTASFKSTAGELGVRLIFSDAQQKQENQISAIRSCIAQVLMLSLCLL